MPKSFVQKHDNYMIFTKERAIPRSDLWHNLSSEFRTSLKEENCLHNTYRKRSYFLDFSPNKPVSKLSCLAYNIMNRFRLEEHPKIFKMFLSEADRDRMLFEDLGYYDVKTKYYLKDHPLFGSKECKHTRNLFVQWHNYCLLFPYLKERCPFGKPE